MTRPDAARGAAPMPRFDAKFIEEQGLVERYLQDELPVKGARELEDWCRVNPQYLLRLRLSDRTQASLKLLEASGHLVDLREPRTAWWKTPYVTIALAVIALMSLVALWALSGKYTLLKSQLEDARVRMTQGSLQPAAVERDLRVSPDRSAGMDHARVAVNRAAPQLLDIHIDMGYTKNTQFRLIVDKEAQGRALILDNLLKDSNGELRLTFNTTGLAVGVYKVRIDGLPFRGGPAPEGWLILDVQ